MLTTPLLAAYVTSLAGTSYGFWGNVSARRWGVMPVVLDEIAQKEKVNELVKASQWQAFFNKAKGDMVTIVPLTVASLGYLAYSAAAGSLTRQLLITSATSLFAVGPWTAIGLMPTNNKLEAIVARGDEQQAISEVPDLLKMWKSRNDVRMALFFTSWSVLVASILVQL